jgi:hypothetical protein
MLANFGIAALLAAAGGLAYLAVKHPRVYNKVGLVIAVCWLFVWTLMSAYAVGTLMAMSALTPFLVDKLELARAAVESVQPSLLWTWVLGVAGLAFVLVMHIIAQLVLEDAGPGGGRSNPGRNRE